VHARGVRDQAHIRKSEYLRRDSCHVNMTFTTESLTVDEQTRRRLFTDARSPLAFADEPVSPAVIEAAYDLIKWGPTSNNSMPLRLAIADSDWARTVVVDAATAGNRPKVASAPTVLVVAADADYHEFSHVTAPGVAGLRERLAGMPEQRLTTARENTWVQLGYLVVGLRAMGLAVRPMTGFDMTAISDALFGDNAWNAQAVLTVGYPAANGEDGTAPRAGRPAWDDAARVL